MKILDFLSIPLGKLLYFIYYKITFENYGLSLILFTILTRLAMLPLTIKQYQSSAKMMKLNPKLEDLRRQYGTDKQKLQEETMKLYQEEKINPAGGCLPLLIQFPILFSLYPVITQPLRYMLGKTQEQITALQDLFKALSGNVSNAVQQMQILNFFKTDAAAMSQAQADGLLKASDLINMNFLGLDLSKTPTYSPGILFGDQMAVYLPLLLIPIVGVVSTYISGKIAMASTAAQSSANQQATSMNKTMQFIGPVMTLIFSFQLPAGVLVYWIAGYLIQIVQQLFINKYVLKLDNVITGKSKGISTNKSTGISTNKSAGSGAGGSGSGGKNTGGGSGSGNSAGGSGSSKSAGGGGSSRSEPAYHYREGQSDTPGKSISVVTSKNSGDNTDTLVAGGGSVISKALGFTGFDSSEKVRAAGSDGIVHGNEFASNVWIPGITDAGDVEYLLNADHKARYMKDGNKARYMKDDKQARYMKDGAYAADAEDTADGDADAVANAAADVNATAGINAAAGASQPETQRSRHIDARSSTQKNYGSSKRKKKK